MNNVKTARLARLKWPRNLLVVLLVVAASLGYYLFFFVVKANFHEVVPNKVYRSAQPSPAQLKKWVRRYGIRTVINLRGDVRQITEQEQAIADQLGIGMITIRFKSSSLPTRDSLTKLIQAIETSEQPILIHCGDGVDRTDMASVLAAMAIGKESYDTAKWRAYIPPGPWKRDQHNKYVHISDMFKLYERYRQRNKPRTNDWQDFKQWSAVTDTFGDMDTKYRHDYCYFSQINKADWFYPIVKLVRDAWIQFAVELVILSVLAVVMYRKLSRIKWRE